MSGGLVITCSVVYKNCKCFIDIHLTFPVLSCTSKTLSYIFLQILKLGLYFKSKVFLGYGFLLKTVSPILKFVLSGTLTGTGHLSLAIFRFNTAIISMSHIVSKWIPHFSSPMYLSFGNNNLNRVGIKGLYPNIKYNGASPTEECRNIFYAIVAI